MCFDRSLFKHTHTLSRALLAQVLCHKLGYTLTRAVYLFAHSRSCLLSRIDDSIYDLLWQKCIASSDLIEWTIKIGG